MCCAQIRDELSEYSGGKDLARPSVAQPMTDREGKVKGGGGGFGHGVHL